MPKPRQQPTVTNTVVHWPQLNASECLELERLNEDLITIDNLFEPTQLKQWRKFCQTLQLAAPEPPKPGHAHRTNYRFQTDDPEFASRLWTQTGLQDLCLRELPSHVKGKKPCGLNSNIRIYRYPEESFFGREWRNNHKRACALLH